MKREPWTGTAPIGSSKAIAQRFKETDDDGSEWYLAIGPAGDTVEHALVIPRGKRLAEMQASQAAADARWAKRKAGETRIEQLKQKRLEGKSLTAAEQQEILDSLLGL